jgi:hypothetical protein
VRAVRPFENRWRLPRALATIRTKFRTKLEFGIGCVRNISEGISANWRSLRVLLEPREAKCGRPMKIGHYGRIRSLIECGAQ